MARPIRSRGLDVLEAHLRFKEGEKVPEEEWDREVIPNTAKKYVNEYDIEMDPSKPIPEDEALKDDLFEAGIEMLTEIGIFNLDREKVMEVKEEEIKAGLAKAPKRLTLGSGKNAADLRQRTGNPDRPPLTQGGPTGAPVAEEDMVQMHQTYAQDTTVDTIVDGVPGSFRNQATPAGTPWEIAGAMFELRSVREACARADRPNMGL
ncbi:hypothetical protein AKJ51_03645 [candidate division MSBL1 archaeon SCGC-AAA382A20]|uniref:[methylamine--corrinoid protein] Co-methyltransferase n=1 Tax=candidate division MSBL1 archaeon SCGC-AAA382A20 TaxID=1698280 RepID=A0A133VJ55_9EURY|nr:hypothetical protein AKJ51_03645 [candidate division MSBL1 archaeon SCGC-AAA382A20]